ncbi:MAG TPA: hypothetical protein VKV04_14215 [Verrucomicrobiae bacterium]|jgi:hypothetical protein|nr:hypothetical protein [Verrucomicrobiae bacterium]
MKKIKIHLTALPRTLAALIERSVSTLQGVRRNPQPVPLANALALGSDSGFQTLQIDPGATLPIASKYLIYERGSAYNYARIAGGTNVPLGVSSDAPFALGDFLNIRRLGAKKGFEFGIPAGAIAADHLVAVDPAGTGKVVDLTTQGNGTYWVVGRATQAAAATDIEVSYVPDIPYQVNNNNGTWTYVGANV